LLIFYSLLGLFGVRAVPGDVAFVLTMEEAILPSGLLTLVLFLVLVLVWPSFSIRVQRPIGQA